MLTLVLAVSALLDCGDVRGARPETDPALTARFMRIRERSGLGVALGFCRMPDRGNPTAGSRMTMGRRGGYVYISERGRRFSSPAQDALLAHELAHLVLSEGEEEPPFWHVMEYREYLERETKADALGATWVGRGAFAAAFSESLSAHDRGPGFIKEITYRDLKLKGW